jgi:hypothetical protein
MPPIPAVKLPSALPRTSRERLSPDSAKTTILYLAYGSNLSSRSFKGIRNIIPLSAVNAHVPSLTLNFDFPGIPYLEPCFANTAYSNSTPAASQVNANARATEQGKWQKGLLGVVYELAPNDYRTVLSTEGGGSSYKVIQVPCYALPVGTPDVDPEPRGDTFMVHTLLQPRDTRSAIKRVQRPSSTYAQPSARYINLLIDGAKEHGLPMEYIVYLFTLQPYAVTTSMQKIGKTLFLAIWQPIIAATFRLGKLLANDEGQAPVWWAGVLYWVAKSMWFTYDWFFLVVFGDGERTIESNIKRKE